MPAVLLDQNCQRPGHAYRLKDLAGLGIHAPGAEVLPGSQGVDENRMMCRGIITTADEDRVKDIVVPEGGQFDHYYRSGNCWFFNHQQIPFSVGMAERPDGSRSTQIFPGDRDEQECWFHQATKEAVEVFHLVRLRALLGISIAFNPISEPIPLPRRGGQPGGSKYSDWDLLEVSFTFVPANPYARVTHYEPYPAILRSILSRGTLDGSSSISPLIRKSLLPLAERAPAWSPGWTPTSFFAPEAKCQVGVPKPGPCPGEHRQGPGLRPPGKKPKGPPARRGDDAMARLQQAVDAAGPLDGIIVYHSPASGATLIDVMDWGDPEIALGIVEAAGIDPDEVTWHNEQAPPEGEDWIEVEPREAQAKSIRKCPGPACRCPGKPTSFFARGKASFFRAKGHDAPVLKAESFFGTCDRDDKGHCKPGGGGKARTPKQDQSLAYLASGPKTIGEIADHLGVTPQQAADTMASLSLGEGKEVKLGPKRGKQVTYKLTGEVPNRESPPAGDPEDSADSAESAESNHPAESYLDAFNDPEGEPPTAEQARQANDELERDGSDHRIAPGGDGKWQAVSVEHLEEEYGPNWSIEEDSLTGHVEVGDGEYYYERREASGDDNTRSYLHALNEDSAGVTADDIDRANAELEADGSEYRIEWDDQWGACIAVPADDAVEKSLWLTRLRRCPGAVRKADSFFATCERNPKTGGCLPKGEHGTPNAEGQAVQAGADGAGQGQGRQPGAEGQAQQPGAKAEGGAQPAAPPQPSMPASKARVKAKNIFQMLKVKKAVKDLFGGDYQAVASCVGAPDDATVSLEVSPDGATLWAKVSHPALQGTMDRAIFRNPADGTVWMKNDYIRVKQKGGGFGTKVFQQQVEWAQAKGISAITAHCARLGPSGRPDFDGYTFWAKCGYNQALAGPGITYEAEEDKVHAAEAMQLFGAKSVQDVVKTPEGQAWWDKNGFAMTHGVFNLEPGSKALKKFAEYQQGAAARRAARQQQAQQQPQKGISHVRRSGCKPRAGRGPGGGASAVVEAPRDGGAAAGARRAVATGGRRQGGAEEKAVLKAEPFFGTCERDDKGRCKPGGSSGEDPGGLTDEDYAAVTRFVDSAGTVSEEDRSRLARLAQESTTRRKTLQRVFKDVPPWRPGEVVDLDALSFSGADLLSGKSAGQIGWKYTDSAVCSIESPRRGLDVDYSRVGMMQSAYSQERETIVAGRYRVKEVRKVTEPGTKPQDGYTVPLFVLEELSPAKAFVSAAAKCLIGTPKPGPCPGPDKPRPSFFARAGRAAASLFGGGAKPTEPPSTVRTPPPEPPSTSRPGSADRASLAGSPALQALPLPGKSCDQLVLLTLEGGGQVVFKSGVGERPDLRAGVKAGTYWRREVATSEVADLLGLGDLVPATVRRTEDGAEGSAQQYIERASEAFSLDADRAFDGKEDAARAATLDYLTANLDRHMKNWLVGADDGKLWLIDNGLSWPVEHYSTDWFNLQFLSHAAEKGLKVPDLKSWRGRWPEVEAALTGNGLEPEAVAAAKVRFDSLVKHSGKPFADMPPPVDQPGWTLAQFVRAQQM